MEEINVKFKSPNISNLIMESINNNNISNKILHILNQPSLNIPINERLQNDFINNNFTNNNFTDNKDLCFIEIDEDDDDDIPLNKINNNNLFYDNELISDNDLYDFLDIIKDVDININTDLLDEYEKKYKNSNKRKQKDSEEEQELSKTSLKVFPRDSKEKLEDSEEEEEQEDFSSKELSKTSLKVFPRDSKENIFILPKSNISLETEESSNPKLSEGEETETSGKRYIPIMISELRPGESITLDKKGNVSKIFKLDKSNNNKRSIKRKIFTAKKTLGGNKKIRTKKNMKIYFDTENNKLKYK
jgi:hypothetical protein